jgi:hypothetical protein
LKSTDKFKSRRPHSCDRRLFSSGNETLVNPVSIEQKSSDGTIVDRITATRGSTVESAGALTSSDNFPQSSWTAWSRQTYDLFGHMLTSRVYHAIPASGDGVAGTNFVESSYASDEMGRQNKSVAAGQRNGDRSSI